LTDQFKVNGGEPFSMGDTLKRRLAAILIIGILAGLAAACSRPARSSASNSGQGTPTHLEPVLLHAGL
jgi:hypothetical protein